MELLTGFLATFASSASAIAASAVTVHLRNHTKELVHDKSLTCESGDGNDNCALSSSYGTVLLFLNLLSLVFNGILLLLLLGKWYTVHRHAAFRRDHAPKWARLQRRVSLILLGVTVATATAVLNVYLHQNFGHELEQGHLGATCRPENGLAGCSSLQGVTGNVVFATNIATLATSGVVLLFCLVAFGSKVTRSLIRDMHDFQAEQAKESKSAKTTTKPKAT